MQVDPSKTYESVGNITYDETGQRINRVEAEDVQEKRDVFRDLFLYKTVSKTVASVLDTKLAQNTASPTMTVLLRRICTTE